jgi:hypothetical protein
MFCHCPEPVYDSNNQVCLPLFQRLQIVGCGGFATAEKVRQLKNIQVPIRQKEKQSGKSIFRRVTDRQEGNKGNEGPDYSEQKH